MTRRFCAGIALLLALPPSPALAAAPAARLVYSRTADAASCADEDALRRAVATRVGYDPFFPWAKRTVIATITRQDAAFVATVDLVDDDGIRHGGHQLRTEGACADLLDTVALAVAIAIDPQLLLATPPPPSPPPERADLPSPPPPIPLPPLEPQARLPPAHEPPAGPRPPSLVFEGSLGVAAAIEVTPGVSFGGTLGADVRWRRLSLGIEGFIAAPSSRSAANGEAGSISSWPLLGTLVPCVYVGPVFGCALAQTGAIFSAAEGVTGGHSSSSPWWALGGRVGVMVRVQPVFLRFRVDVLGDTSPATLKLDGSGQWTAPVVAGSLGLDAVVRFP
jgi:hypothetical protein